MLLAHGPSERPRKANFAFWAVVGDELNIEISGDSAHVLELDTRLYSHAKLPCRRFGLEVPSWYVLTSGMRGFGHTNGKNRCQHVRTSHMSRGLFFTALQAIIARI